MTPSWTSSLLRWITAPSGSGPWIFSSPTWWHCVHASVCWPTTWSGNGSSLRVANSPEVPPEQWTGLQAAFAAPVRDRS